jgi:ABC-type sulfate/molybdate transport systems ATPase subunit
MMAPRGATARGRVMFEGRDILPDQAAQARGRIGFVPQDTRWFKKMLEMNVIAPGLSDVRLLEDTHVSERGRGLRSCLLHYFV